METHLSVSCKQRHGRDESGMKKLYETAIIFIGTLGWWGFVYPELSEVMETCVQEEQESGYTGENSAQEINEDVPQKDVQEQPFWEEICESLGKTGVKSGNVRIKSRIAEYLYQDKEKSRSEKESGYEG